MYQSKYSDSDIFESSYDDADNFLSTYVQSQHYNMRGGKYFEPTYESTPPPMPTQEEHAYFVEPRGSSIPFPLPLEEEIHISYPEDKYFIEQYINSMSVSYRKISENLHKYLDAMRKLYESTVKRGIPCIYQGRTISPMEWDLILNFLKQIENTLIQGFDLVANMSSNLIAM